MNDRTVPPAVTQAQLTYLTTEELAERIRYDARTIRNRMVDHVLLEGKHYFRPFGGRKILFIWEAIERDMGAPSAGSVLQQPRVQAAPPAPEPAPPKPEPVGFGTPLFYGAQQITVRLIEPEIAKSKPSRAEPEPQPKPAKVKAKPAAPAAPIPTPTSSESPESKFPTLNDYQPLWFAKRDADWSRAYRVSVKSIFDLYLSPRFGNWPLDRFNIGALQSFQQDLVRRSEDDAQTGITPGTINRIIGMLRTLLEDAQTDYALSFSFRGFKRLKVEEEVIQVFTEDERDRLIENARGDYRDCIQVRFFGGLLAGETHGLKWKHVNLAANTLRIEESFQGGFTEPRPVTAQRTIEMNPKVRQAILRRHSEQAAADPENYVFCTSYGQPIDNSNFNDRIWKPLLEDLRIPWRRPHVMRHTCAAQWLLKAEPPEWVAQQLGLSSTEMLYRTYARFMQKPKAKVGASVSAEVNTV